MLIPNGKFEDRYFFNGGPCLRGLRWRGKDRERVGVAIILIQPQAIILLLG
jgi:hypothetical protein